MLLTKCIVNCLQVLCWSWTRKEEVCCRQLACSSSEDSRTLPWHLAPIPPHVRWGIPPRPPMCEGGVYPCHTPPTQPPWGPAGYRDKLKRSEIEGQEVGICFWQGQDDCPPPSFREQYITLAGPNHKPLSSCLRQKICITGGGRVYTVQ